MEKLKFRKFIDSVDLTEDFLYMIDDGYFDDFC